MIKKTLYCFLLLSLLCGFTSIEAYYPSYPSPSKPQIPRDTQDDHWNLNPQEEWAVGHFDFEYPYVMKQSWEPIWDTRIGLGLKAEDATGSNQVFYARLSGNFISEDGASHPDNIKNFISTISKFSKIEFPPSMFQAKYADFYTFQGKANHLLFGEGNWKLFFWDHRSDIHVMLAVYFGQEDPEIHFQKMENLLNKD